MEVHHILLLEQDYCRARDHVFEKLDKTKREAKYRVEPSYKGKAIPLQARFGPEGEYRYSSTLPLPQH
jgi:hypothetical protein